jgi:prepilin-type N-terminal cleavage/methylation domain-containing protein
VRAKTRGFPFNDNPNWKQGFSLLELMVVVAIIGVLLAISLPAVRKAKSHACRIGCQTNLHQSYLGWNTYLVDNNDMFYTGLNAHLNYGGWEGKKKWVNRPLNPYIDQYFNGKDPRGAAKVFLCPGDNGGVPNYSPYTKAFDIFGTSYQMNPILVGYGQLPVLDNPFKSLHGAINRRIPNLKRDSVDHPGKVVLMGDYHWALQWMATGIDNRSWHDKMDYYTILFLDGNAGLIQIHPGVYHDLHYTVLPDKTLYHEADIVQPGP